MPDRLSTTDHQDDQQFLNHNHRVVTGTGAPNVGSRLFGSRVGAGFLNTRQVVALFGSKHRDYADAERGRRPVDRSMLEVGVEAYKVTREYLLDGIVGSPADALAHRLAEVQQQYLAHWESLKVLDDDEMGRQYVLLIDRLRFIRETAGHASPQAASIAHGWPGNLYWEHETGGRPLQPDRFMGYCLAMGGRPEYGLLGLGPLWETEAIGWQERKPERREDGGATFR